MFESLVRVEEDGDYWRLLRPLVYRGNEDRWEIETGFRTDFASIPRLVRWLLDRTGKHNRAAVAHDKLAGIAAGIVASCHDPMHSKVAYHCSLNPYVSRLDADRIFLRMLRELEVPEWQARLMYAGVRLGWWLRL